MISLWQQQALTEYQINMSVIDRSSLRHMWRGIIAILSNFISSNVYYKNVLFIIIWLVQLKDVYKKVATLKKSQEFCYEPKKNVCSRKKLSENFYKFDLCYQLSRRCK